MSRWKLGQFYDDCMTGCHPRADWRLREGGAEAVSQRLLASGKRALTGWRRLTVPSNPAAISVARSRPVQRVGAFTLTS